MEKPWETPKIQMIVSIFNGTISSVDPINIMEVKANAQEV